MFRKFVLASLFLIFVSTPAIAGIMGGQDLASQGWRLFQRHSSGGDMTPEEMFRVLYWQGYVTGAVDAGDGIAFTLPIGTTANQVFAIVGKWIDEHPTEWNKPADVIIWAALKEAFPYKPQ